MTHRIRAVTALPQASRCECGIAIWNIVNKPPFKKGFSLKSSFLAARNLTFRCKLLKFGPQTVFWRLKNDSFEFFWIYAKSEDSLQICKVLASDVVLRAQERVLGFCDAKI
jgi:hypothetical protein